MHHSVRTLAFTIVGLAVAAACDSGPGTFTEPLARAPHAAALAETPVPEHFAPSPVGGILYVRGGLVPAAAFTTFTTRVAFQSALPGLPVEDFDEGNVDPDQAVSCPRPLNSATNNACFHRGDILPGLQINTVGPPRGATEFVLTGPGFFGVPSKELGANYFEDALELDFVDGACGVGVDLDALFAHDAVNVDVYDRDGALLGSAVVATPGFFGVVSNVKISRIVVTSPTSQAETVDNVAFGCRSCLSGVAEAKVRVALSSLTLKDKGTLQLLLTALPRGSRYHQQFNAMVSSFVRMHKLTAEEGDTLIGLVAGCP